MSPIIRRPIAARKLALTLSKSRSTNNSVRQNDEKQQFFLRHRMRLITYRYSNLVKRAQTKLVELHFEPRPHLVQHHILPTSILVHVMTEEHNVLLVGERHHPMRVGLRTACDQKQNLSLRAQPDELITDTTPTCQGAILKARSRRSERRRPAKMSIRASSGSLHCNQNVSQERE